ncbi:hypothetical protein ACFPRL_14185 [Pseudoclavibacter helvolus]
MSTTRLCRALGCARWRSCCRAHPPGRSKGRRTPSCTTTRRTSRSSASTMPANPSTLAARTMAGKAE